LMGAGGPDAGHLAPLGSAWSGSSGPRPPRWCRVIWRTAFHGVAEASPSRSGGRSWGGVSLDPGRGRPALALGVGRDHRLIHPRRQGRPQPRPPAGQAGRDPEDRRRRRRHRAHPRGLPLAPGPHPEIAPVARRVAGVPPPLGPGCPRRPGQQEAQEDESLITAYAGSSLKMELDRIPLWGSLLGTGRVEVWRGGLGPA
jgi:hypothetical protein